jgi:hypothetical protein
MEKNSDPYQLLKILKTNKNFQTLTRSAKFKKHIALRMMIFLSVSDGLQLVIHMFTGILSIFELEIDYTCNTVHILVKSPKILILR